MKPPGEFLKRWLHWMVAAIFVAIATALVVIPPSVGLSNNGDFERLMGPLGLDYDTPIADRHYGPVIFHFPKAAGPPLHHLNPLTRAALTLPFWPAVGLSRLMVGTTFDLRWAGLVQIAILGLAIGLWMRATRERKRWERLILAGALLLIFGDIGYLAFVNSFYSEPVSLSYFLLALGCLLNAGLVAGRNGKSTRWIFGYFLFSLLFACTKAQYALASLPMAALGVFAWQRVAKNHRLAAPIAVACAIVALSACSLASYEPEALLINKYNTVFGGVLMRSPNVAADLQEFDLPPSMADLARTCPWSINTRFFDPQFRRVYFPKINPLRVTLFYARHPDRFYVELAAVCREMSGVRLYYLRNFDTAAGINGHKVPDLLSAADLPAGARWKWRPWMFFSSWSGLKEGAMNSLLGLDDTPGLRNVAVFGPLWIWLVFGAINLLIGLWQAARAGGAQQAVNGGVRAVLAICLLMIPPIVLLGDGEWEAHRHLFMANAAADLLLILALSDLLRWVASRR